MADIDPSEITPVSGAETAEAPAPDQADDGLPDELLAQPFIAALMQGKPAAVYVPNDFTSPEVELVIKNADALGKAGFRLYPSQNKPITVLFNAVELSPEEVKKADENGTLDQIAIPFQELQEVIAGAGVDAPAAGSAAAAPAQPVPSAPPDAKTTSARIKNVAPGTPTSGPTPGQGRLISNIAKAVI